MKNIFRYALLFAATGVMSLGFTSCGDDDDDSDVPAGSVLADASTLQNIVNSYVDNVVDPTYKDLRTSAEALNTACQTLYAHRSNNTLTQTDINAACEAFIQARKYWEQSEAFLYGAATNDGIDPHMDSWPLDQTQLANALTPATVIAGITGENPARYVYTSNGEFDSTMGFHGLEFVLFRNGAPRTLAAFTAEYEDGEGLNTKGDNLTENQRKLRQVTTLQEAAFAAAVAGDLHNMTTLLEYEWTGDAQLGSYLTTNASWVLEGTRNNGKAVAGEEDDAASLGVDYIDAVRNIGSGYLFTDWRSNIKNILVGGCFHISQEVYTQKLAQAYRRTTNHPEEGDAADYIESPYSKRSFQDYQDNIYSIKNSLYGVRGTENINTPAANSIMNFLRANYPDYNTLNNALNNAISTLEAAKTSGTSFIDDPGNAQVQRCITAVQALDEALNTAGTWCERNIVIRR